MKKGFLVLLLTFFSFAALADTLHIARSISDRTNNNSAIENIAAYLISGLNGEYYDSYDIFAEPDTNLEKFIKDVKSEHIDLLVESIFTANKIMDKTNMEPALLISRSGSVFIKGILITRKDSGIASIKQLKGKSVAVTDRYSTSSYHLFQHSAKSHGIKTAEIDEPKQGSSKDAIGVYISGSKKKAINSVYLKKTDAASICQDTWNDKTLMPDFIKSDLKIIHETKSVPGLYLLIRKDMDKAKKKAIIDILLKMDGNITGVNPRKGCRITGFHNSQFNWDALFKSFDNLQ
jgi:phosphonate transport system substrate-binding protein